MYWSSSKCAKRRVTSVLPSRSQITMCPSASNPTGPEGQTASNVSRLAGVLQSMPSIPFSLRHLSARSR
eukprot:scaffold231971_cov32-Tisochrysis_lutea.AAC.2